MDNDGFGGDDNTVVTVEQCNSTDRRNNTPLSLCFHKVKYMMGTKGKRRLACCGKAGEKAILKSMSGIMEPGINAIMGVTGSGKTSLLDVLAGRKHPEGKSGDVFLDGKPIPENFPYMSGYVVQNDLLVGVLTVRESLWFCANMRLPASVKFSEKRARIEKVLTDLRLNSCADTRIGTTMIRGISGGERKRTSIALEMILNPKILFLDEPTTGLDASTASSVMDLLRNLGRQGNVIICSVHQPRFSIFELFDTLTLLSEGTLVYHGAAEGALKHFQESGYVCPLRENPAEFLLDILYGRYERNFDGNQLDSAQMRENTEDSPCLAEKLRRKYAESEYHTLLSERLKGTFAQRIIETTTAPGKMYATGPLRQLRFLLARTFKNTVRNPAALVSGISLNVILGILFGILYFRVRDDGSGLQNRSGILFFICTTLLFGSVSVVNAFTAERDIFIHEYVSGYYRVFSYFAAKVLADLIPLRTIAPIFFGAITYWMVGLKPSAGAFIIFLLTCLLLGYASVGIGLFYSATFQQPVAQVLLILTYVFTLIFSGLLVNVDAMLPWISWLKYLSVARFGFIGLSVNEFRDRTFTSCVSNGTSPSFVSVNVGADTVNMTTQCTTIKGETFLHSSLSVGSSADEIGEWELWVNIVALACVCVGIYLLTYIQLLRLRKYY